MKVFITGGSGLIGRHLARRLLEDGHQPVILSRHSDAVRRKPEFRELQVVQGDPDDRGRWQGGGRRLRRRRQPGRPQPLRRALESSRSSGRSATAGSMATEHVVAAIRQARNRPQVLVQASAIGFYGPHGDEELTSRAPRAPTSWRSSAASGSRPPSRSTELGVRRAVVRIGVVLAPGEGALAFMTPIFKLGPGAPIGSGGKLGPAKGQQWMSWIHIDDIAGSSSSPSRTPRPSGPINGTAPHPVRNAEFSKTLSSVLWKPYAPWRFFIPLGPPDALLQLMLGEVAGVVTAGQKVLPRKAQALGYRFKYPDLADALRDVFTDKPAPAEAQARARRGRRRRPHH